MPNTPNMPNTSASRNFSSNMGADIPLSNIENPQTNQQVFEASFSGILQQSIGYYVVCEFLIGTTLIVEKDGILYSSGINFMTLYQEEYDRFIVCDLYSLKFLTIYPVKSKPRYLISQNTNQPGSGNQGGTRYAQGGTRPGTRNP